MTTAARAAEPLLPNLSIPDGGAPGEFAFAEGGRVRRILNASGWKNVDVRPIDVTGTMTEQDLLTYVTKLGPVGGALREAEVDEATRAHTASVVRAAATPVTHFRALKSLCNTISRISLQGRSREGLRKCVRPRCNACRSSIRSRYMTNARRLRPSLVTRRLNG
jgi:hypothetical protein